MVLPDGIAINPEGMTPAGQREQEMPAFENFVKVFRAYAKRLLTKLPIPI
jgi:hypothetical protein